MAANNDILKNKQWIYSKRPEKEVSEEHFTLNEVDMSTKLEEGEIIIKSIYLSVDPYHRIQMSAKKTWEDPFPLSKVQGGGCVGKVIFSRNSNWKVGDFISCYSGWQLYAKLSKEQADSNFQSRGALKKTENIRYSYALSITGMPGRTAWGGFIETAKPKQGETVVVSGAAGAVGSIVVQLARVSGCSNIIGIAGSNEKLEFLKTLGCHHTINYKENASFEKMNEKFKQYAPNGIDIYFDNVGGYITDAVFESINLRARIIICGQISQYSGGLDNPNLGPRFLHKLIYTRATIQGILARDFTPRHKEMLQFMEPLIEQKKITYRETIENGFENVIKALKGLFTGNNIGKMIVQVCKEEED